MKINFKKYLPVFVSTGIMILFLFISAICFFVKGYGKRFVFIFPGVDAGDYVVETRYLKENPNKDYLAYYADELMLGSGLERTKYLFKPGSRILSCFERNKVVYIDLSADIINMGHNVIDIKDGIDLLKKNITKNFPYVEDIKVCVDGKYAFE